MARIRNRQIEILARGVCVRRGRLLYCHSRGAANTYLPGGHVEFGESAAHALRRELREELGVSAEVGRLLGAVEHTFLQKGRRHCEINLVFAFRLTDADLRGLESQEEKIEFGWLPLTELAGSPLEPAPLREQLPRWVEKGARRVGWASTYG